MEVYEAASLVKPVANDGPEVTVQIACAANCLGRCTWQHRGDFHLLA